MAAFIGAQTTGVEKLGLKGFLLYACFYVDMKHHTDTSIKHKSTSIGVRFNTSTLTITNLFFNASITGSHC